MSARERPLAGPGDTPDNAVDALRVFFQQFSPRVMLAGAIGRTIVRLRAGEWSAADLLIPCVIAALWPFQEWLIHVLVLHFRPRQLGRVRIDLMNAKKHRQHHRDPWRIPLIFIPWFTAAAGFFVIPALAFWVALKPTHAMTAAAFYLWMALRYEWFHYICHIRWCPPWRHYKALVDSHRLHHFKNEHYWMGVSMLMGDRVLGTSPDPKGVARSETVRTLGVATIEG